FQHMSVAWVFAAEWIAPFFIWMGRRLRLAAFAIFTLLQGGIFLTGNYGFFNLLTILLGLWLLDDRGYRAAWSIQDDCAREGPRPLRLFGTLWRGALAALIFWTSGLQLLAVAGFGPGNALPAPSWLTSLRSVNSYGLFAVMTTTRPEIEIEGSADGKVWRTYPFRYKAQALNQRPRQVAPYQPRLDWQMWFAALGTYEQNPWFVNLCLRLLQGSQPVLGLFQANPFPDKPPRFIRAQIYDYRFTDRKQRADTENWWTRRLLGAYLPAISLEPQARAGARR
ncbi:MAG TPA: lipase maturation factor family protein, partial [Elusimicrobiota bacterium]|nr:lipase maturation factor family protein [Elusimicrobiota bacterium]